MNGPDLEPQAHDQQWLVGGGEMGELIRSIDWSAHPLGPLESWPNSLRTTVSLCLASNFPINILWGPGSSQIYNDGYRVIVGEKHPEGMGMGYKECWESAWPEVGEPFERAWAGETSFIEDRRMFVERGGYLEETFFTFSLSPIRDERGIVAGLFLPVTETRTQMLGQRRTKALGELAANTAKARTLEESFERCAETFTEHSLDLPFVLLYSVSGDGAEARLVASAGVERGLPVSPAQVRLAEEADRSWRMADILAADSMVEISGLKARFGEFACGPYPEGANVALARALRVPGVNAPLGIVIAGISPRLPFDQEYRNYVERLAGAVDTALGNALAYQRERQRAEELAALDRTKTQFFSNVSHEFRTPLTLILGPLDDALGQAGLSAELREQLEVARRNSLRLLRLVNSLLDFSRIEAGRVKAVFHPTDLSALTAGLASIFRSATERAGLQLTIDCPPLPEPVFVDVEMWEKVVLNLLSNAFKFTFDGGIVVQLTPLREAVELSVSDTGVGIPEHELPRLFERFHRVEGTRGRTFEGTGIGLALVQELVRLHGGAIAIESVLGQGSTFRVRIPLGAAHLPPEQIGGERELSSTAVRAEAFVAEALRWLPDDAHTSPVAGPSELIGHETAAAASARVLVVDDNADMRDYIRRLLSGRYEVVTAADGEEGLASALRVRPDLVLTDIMMPGMDGFEMIDKLRAAEPTSTIPIIVLSARAGEESRVEGLEKGADDYLIKPFSALELQARVRTHLALAESRKRATGLTLELEAQNRLADELATAQQLQAISTELISEQQPGELYDKLLGAAMALMKADAASVQILDHQGLRLGLLASRNLHPESAAYWEWVDASSRTSCGIALKTNTRVVIEDIENYAELAGTQDLAEYRRCGFRAVQSTPLISRTGQRLGMLSTHWCKPHQTAQRDFGFLDVLARQAADLIERSRAEAALRKSEQRFQQFAKASAAALWIRDAKTLAMEFASPAIASIYGVEPDALMGDLKPWASMIVPEDRELALENIERACKGESVVHEFRIQRWDNYFFRWIRNTDFPLRDNGHIPRIGGIAEDITEAKLAIEHQGVLLAELQHRVRNIMAIIRSIAARTGERAECVPQYTQLLSGRLLALSRVQALLTRAANANVSIATIVHDEVSVQARHEGQYDLNGPDVLLSPKAAEVLTLAVHELATNALKYGAISVPHGKVAIEWTTFKKQEAVWLAFDWKEEGAPLRPKPTGPQRRGFGSELIEGRIPYELRGSGRITIEPGGARCHLEFPLREGPSVLETGAPQRATVFGGALDMTGGPDLSAYRILVVEDEFYLATDIARALEGAGAEVTGPSPDEEAARAELKEQRPDAVVLDINLGHGPSFKLAEKLKDEGIPFVFLTGYDTEVIPAEFHRVERLQKPIELRHVVSAISKLVAPAV